MSSMQSAIKSRDGSEYRMPSCTRIHNMIPYSHVSYVAMGIATQQIYEATHKRRIVGTQKRQHVVLRGGQSLVASQRARAFVPLALPV